MVSLRLYVKVLLVAVPVALVGSVGVANAAFHLEYVDEEDAKHPTIAVKPLVPASAIRATFGRANERHVAYERRQKLAAAPHTGTPSTNYRVDPWGCEADHAQDVSPTGKYWGKYQFDRQTWAAHGGTPSAYGSAPEEVQDAIAANVTYDAWPNC